MIRSIYSYLITVLLLTACQSVGPANQTPGTIASVEIPSSTIAATPTISATDVKLEFETSPRQTGSTHNSYSGNSIFLAPAIMGIPTDTSIVVSLLPVEEMEVMIEYGTESELKTSDSILAHANMPVEITLANLQPDTKYHFTVVANQVKYEQHTFHTARAPGSAFTFEIQGDSHPEREGKQFDGALYSRLLINAAVDEPDFYFSMGDDFSVDSLKKVNADSVRAVYHQQREWLPLVDAPVFLVNGNHEQASLANLDGTPDNVAVWAQISRNSLFPQPPPGEFYTGNTQTIENIGLLRNYYAFSWGDALFVVIDPYWHSKQTVDNQFGAGHGSKEDRDLWNVTLGDDQYHWFKQTLENSTAQYKFVFAHHVNGTGRGGIEVADKYEWGDEKGLISHRPGWDKTIHQIMVDSGVTIFFQGHDHIFARQELDGIIYQTLPEPANPFYSLENSDAYLSGDVFPNSGRVRVNVSGSGVLVEYLYSYINKPDKLAFSYTVK